jgi:sec-independent protein translocase protein TatA
MGPVEERTAVLRVGYTGTSVQDYVSGVGSSDGGVMIEGLFQPMHLLVIFFVALLVFGPKKLPELGKGLGEGIRALKDSMKDESKPEDKV